MVSPSRAATYTGPSVVASLACGRYATRLRTSVPKANSNATEGRQHTTFTSTSRRIYGEIRNVQLLNNHRQRLESTTAEMVWNTRPPSAQDVKLSPASASRGSLRPAASRSSITAALCTACWPSVGHGACKPCIHGLSRNSLQPCASGSHHAEATRGPPPSLPGAVATAVGRVKWAIDLVLPLSRWSDPRNHAHTSPIFSVSKMSLEFLRDLRRPAAW